MSSSKKILDLVLVFLIIVFGGSCSPKLEEAIVGKWQKINDTKTIEFCTNGDVKVTNTFLGMKLNNFSGKYKFIGKNTIKIKFEAQYLPFVMALAIFPSYDEILTVSIVGDEMTLASPDGEITEYKRIKK